MQQPRLNASIWIAPATTVVIVLFTIAGIIAPALTDLDPERNAAFGLVAGPLLLVAIVQPALLRASVLPKQFAQAREEGVTTPSVRDTETTGRILIAAFSVAPTIYGIVAGLFEGSGWWAIPFGAIALGEYAWLSRYANAQLESLRLRERTGVRG